MNFRGKSSRVQQAPMTMVFNDAPIPTSVEFMKGSYMQGHRVGPTQPIPIKKCRISPQESEPDTTAADSTSRYDCATWRMYTRITNARRLRAVSRYNHFADQEPMVMMQDFDDSSREEVCPQAEAVSISGIPHSWQQESPSSEECMDDGVFDFDAM